MSDTAMATLPTFNWDTTADQAVNALSDEIIGRNMLITGVSPGTLGSETARTIARFQPGLIVLAGRNEAKIEETKRAIKEHSPYVSLRTLVLDLGDLSQVRKAAAEVVAYDEPIDVVINNAAIMASPYQLTPDGFESQFGTNHLGPFLFTNLIIPKLQGGPEGARIVTVSSDGHAFQPIRFDDPNWTTPGSYDKWLAYAQAKTANALFAKSLAEKLSNDNITSYSLHPGQIKTNIGSHLTEDDFATLMALKKDITAQAQNTGSEFIRYCIYLVNIDVMPGHSTNLHTDLESDGQMRYKSLNQGAATHVIAAFDPRIRTLSGGYLQHGIVDPHAVEPHAADPALAERLWRMSEDMVGQKFYY